MQPPSKQALKVKGVKVIKKPNKVQKSLDSYRVASQRVMSVNSGKNVDSNIGVDVDLEVVINNEGTEWVDVDVVAETSEHSSNSGKGASWARVVSKSPPGLQCGPRGDQDFGEETVQHKV